MVDTPIAVRPRLALVPVDEPSQAAAPREPLGPLLAAAAVGDETAWTAIVRRFERSVWLAARNCGLDDAAAHDVAQLTWERLFRKVHTIRDPDRLLGWLVVTARREAIRVSRRGRREILADDIGALPGRGPSELEQPGADLLRREQAAEVEAGFERLAAPCQQLLRLLNQDPPVDYRTIAGRTGMRVGSIGPTRARCLECLRRQLDASVA